MTKTIEIVTADVLRFHMTLVAESASAHLSAHVALMRRIGAAWEPIRQQIKELRQDDDPTSAPAAHQETPEPTELDRQVAEYKAKADRGEAVSASDLRWLLNELIHERDQRGTR